MPRKNKKKSDSTQALQALVDESNEAKHPYAVYEVWGTMLEALPRDISSKSAEGYLHSLVRQAIWIGFERGRAWALQKKREFLDDSPFPASVRERVMRSWTKLSKNPNAAGLGRFTNFQQGWHNLYASQTHTKKFLELLRTVHEHTTKPAVAWEKAREFARRADVPLRGTPRFSEALHLSSELVFPLVNSEQGAALAQMLGVSATQLIQDRGTYFEHLEEIKRISDGLGCNDYNALDVFLRSLGEQPSAFRKAVQRRIASRRPVAEKEIEDVGQQLDDAGAFDDSNDSQTDRETVVRAIALRRGQPRFRSRLMHAYAWRCAITDCDAIAALEAAHIRPFSRLGTNELRNGLLLRADVHVLFDLGLIGVDTRNWTIVIAQSLQATVYRKLAGRRLRHPVNKNMHPDKKLLDEHRASSRFIAS